MDNLHPPVYNYTPFEGKYNNKGEDRHGKCKTHERQ